VSAIETLLRDPYSVYARAILKLYPQDEIDRMPRASDFGNFVHDALDRFHKTYPDHLPDNVEQEILKIGAAIFDDNFDSPSTKAFWWPRFERIAKWFAIEECERQKTTRPLATEITGKLEITKDFYVTARADRIDKNAQGGLVVIDYKTGVPPTRKSVEKGLSPQLLLEALIAEGGGFKGLDTGRVDALEYWVLKGRRPAGKIITIDHNLDQLKKAALSGVSTLAQHFQDPKTAYLSVPDPKLTPRFNRYKHLARQNEWRFHQKAKAPKNKKAKRGQKE
jgi:ATP-dependent helicase/nuclease subunit B